MTTATPSFPDGLTLEKWNRFGDGYLPGSLGIEIVSIGEQGVESRLPVKKALLAPNGYLHAASVVALADTSCGYGCVALLPEGAKGFTTVELKWSFGRSSCFVLQ